MEVIRSDVQSMIDAAMIIIAASNALNDEIDSQSFKKEGIELLG